MKKHKQIRGQLSVKLWDQIRYQIWDQLWGQIRGQFVVELWGQLVVDLGDQIKMVLYEKT